MATAPEAVTPLTPPTDKPDALYEFVDGEWKETPPMGALAGLLASMLVTELNNFARPKRLGLAVSEVLFRLAPQGPARRPDVAFIAFERWPYTTPPEEDPPAFDLVPNLAVEVNSPTNTFNEITGKVRDYFFDGVQLVWVIVPLHRMVYVYESPEQARILSENHELDGGIVLPGFRLPLESLFAAPAKPS
jgi:Uma2 family endonuclease